MSTYAKLALSGSTNGRGVLVVQTATAGTTIHTAASGTTSFDEVWIWATNQHTADIVLTIEYGGVTVPNDNVSLTIPTGKGLVLVIPGLLIQNSLVIKAFAAVANKIVLNGFVNRIS